MADLNIANNPVASPMVPEPIKPVYQQPNVPSLGVPAPSMYEQVVPAPPAYEQPTLPPVPVPALPMNAPMDPMNAPMDPMNAPSSENVNKNDLKFKEKTEKFENLVMDLHEQYMNLPEKIGKYAHDKLLVNAERILTDYSDYVTPNVEYMVENMKQKLELLNPSGGIGQKGEKIFNKLKGYLKNFLGQSINFSQFKGNTKGLNEQFNIVLSKLIENLKNGTKDEITTLVQLLNKLIKEMMKKHSVGKDLKPEDFLERIKNLAMRPIQIIRGDKGDPDSVKTNVVMGEGKSDGQTNVTFETKNPKYNVGIDARLKKSIDDNKIDTEKDKEIKGLKDQLQEALKDDEKNKVVDKLRNQIEDAKKQRTKTEAEKRHLEKTYKEDNFKHLTGRILCVIRIFKDKIENYKNNKDNPNYISGVKKVYDEIIDRIDINLYSPKFNKEKRDYLKEKREETKTLFDDFLNKIMTQAQQEQEQDTTPQDCDEKGWKKWFNETFEILKQLKNEDENSFNNLYDKVLNKIEADKVEFTKLPDTDSKTAGKLEMVNDAIAKLEKLKAGDKVESVPNAETEEEAKRLEQEKAAVEEQRQAQLKQEAKAEKERQEAKAREAEKQRQAEEAKAEKQRLEQEKVAAEKARRDGENPKKVGTYSPIEKCYSYHDVYCLLNLSKKKREIISNDGEIGGEVNEEGNGNDNDEEKEEEEEEEEEVARKAAEEEARQAAQREAERQAQEKAAREAQAERVAAEKAEAAQKHLALIKNLAAVKGLTNAARLEKVRLAEEQAKEAARQQAEVTRLAAEKAEEVRVAREQTEVKKVAEQERHARELARKEADAAAKAQAHNINHIQEREQIAVSINKLQGYIKTKSTQNIIEEAPKIIHKLYKIKLKKIENQIFFTDNFNQIHSKIKTFDQTVWREVKKGVFKMSLENFFNTPDNSVDKHILELWGNNNRTVSGDDKIKIMGEYITNLASSSDDIKNQFCKLEGFPFLKDLYNITVLTFTNEPYITLFKKCNDFEPLSVMKKKHTQPNSAKNTHLTRLLGQEARRRNNTGTIEDIQDLW